MSSTTVTPGSASSPAPPYPPIVKGTSLMIAYRLDKRPVLLIGGGNVASGRLYFLLESGAHVTLVAPSPLDPSIVHRLAEYPDDVTWHDRVYSGRDDPLKVEDYAMVLTAIDDNPLSYAVYEMCKEKRVVVNVADVPPKCDFYFGAQMRKGPLQIMVSTGGQGPKIGAMVRDIILDALPPNVEEAIAGVGALRGDLRKRAPGVGGDLGRRRMEWMIGICDEWGLGEMAVLRDEVLRKKVLDQGWDKGGRIVAPSDVRVKRSWTNRNRPNDLIEGAVRGLMAGLVIGAIGSMWWLKSSAR